MASERLWGLLGVLLALFGLVVIAPDVVSTLGAGGHDATGTLLFGVYGAGVVLAVLATLVVIGPDLVRPS
jgi:hypothetical protein